jgi:thymidine kinase
MVGRLEVYTGGMFAGKSTELQRQGIRHRKAGQRVLFIKPMLDQRDGSGVSATHDGQTVEALEINTDLSEITEDAWRQILDAQVVCIDEVQFFDARIIMLVNLLLAKGLHVYAAGLDMDKETNPFEVTALLMALAEKAVKFQAVCNDCSGDAWISYEENPKEGRVNVGNDYVPLCRQCLHNRITAGE